MSLAVVFPGQGSQKIGMLKSLSENNDKVKQVFDIASDVLGYELWDLCQNGTAEKLNNTVVTQPALLAAGYAAYQVLDTDSKKNIKYLAGHSLGEYTALVCADSLDFATGIKLVEKRAEFMQQAVPTGTGTMAAIIGLDIEIIENICNQLSKENNIVEIANLNSPGQIVIAGSAGAVEQAVKLLKEEGAKRAVVLPVSVPSHCSLMKSAADNLKEYMSDIEFKIPKIPVIHNYSVLSYENIDDIKNSLCKQLYSPVRWIETIEYFYNNKITKILECGPGKVLTGLNKRIVKELECGTIEEL